MLGNHQIEAISVLFGVVTFSLAISSYLGMIAHEVLFPLDLVAVSWLVFNLDVPHLAAGEFFKPIQRLPSIIFALTSYLGWRSIEISYAPIVIVILALSLVGSLAALNHFINWENARPRLRNRLRAVLEANRRVDPLFEKKRAVVFWGLISAKETTLVTVMDVLLRPVFAVYFGLLGLTLVIAVLDQLVPAVLIITPVLVFWGFSKTRWPSATRNPFRFLLSVWKLKDRVEEQLSRGILRLFFNPFGFLSFFVLFFCILYALAGLFVIGSFTWTLLSDLQHSPMTKLSLIVLIISGFLPVFVFPGYVGFCLLLSAAGAARTVRLPAHPYSFLAYCIITLLIVGPTRSEIVGIISETQFRSHMLPFIALSGTIIFSINLARGLRPASIFNRNALLTSLFPFFLFFVYSADLGPNLLFELAAFTILWLGITLLFSSLTGTGKYRKIGAILVSLGFIGNCVYFYFENMMAVSMLAAVGLIFVTLVFLFPTKQTERILTTAFGIREEVVENSAVSEPPES